MQHVRRARWCPTLSTMCECRNLMDTVRGRPCHSKLRSGGVVQLPTRASFGGFDVQVVTYVPAPNLHGTAPSVKTTNGNTLDSFTQDTQPCQTLHADQDVLFPKTGYSDETTGLFAYTSLGKLQPLVQAMKCFVDHMLSQDSLQRNGLVMPANSVPNSRTSVA